MKFKVLIIPGLIDDGLNLLSEAMRLGNMGANSQHISIEIMPPERSSEIDIVQLTRGEGRRFDCLHFLGHSDGETFQLASGDVLDEDKIIALCRDAGAKVLFLNACSSAALCQYAANTTVAVALAWAKEVVDGDAILAAMRFYGYLAEHGEPMAGGLRRAYEATGEQRSFLWFTDGQYVRDLIDPIIKRLDRFDVERREAFTSFSDRLDSIVQALAGVGEQMTNGLGKLTNSYSKIRVLLYAIAVLIVVALLALGYAYAASAQTIPDPLPGCDQSGGQPKKCQTPTPAEETPFFGGTIPMSTPTDTPTPRPTDTPMPTVELPTVTHTPTDEPTEAPTPTPTDTPTPEPTVALPTVTPTEETPC